MEDIVAGVGAAVPAIEELEGEPPDCFCRSAIRWSGRWTPRRSRNWRQRSKWNFDERGQSRQNMSNDLLTATLLVGRAALNRSGKFKSSFAGSSWLSFALTWPFSVLAWRIRKLNWTEGMGLALICGESRSWFPS